MILGLGLEWQDLRLPARTLLNGNCSSFVVLEALDVPGGRIRTVNESESVLIELGAQWLHGVDTELHDLALTHALILPETSNEGQGMYVRNDGFVFEHEFVDKIDFHVGRILTECERFVDAEQ